MTLVEKNKFKSVKWYMERTGKDVSGSHIEFTEWEINFINSLKEDYNLSPKQYKVLSKLHDRLGN